MEYDDLSFSFIDENGEERKCEILSIFPNSENELLTMYMDGSLDENGNLIFKYGKLVNIDGNYELKKCSDENEVMNIINKFNEDIYRLANDIKDKLIKVNFEGVF